MIKYKGTTLYPPALFDLLNEMEEVKDYVAEVYSNDIGMDEVLLYILPADQHEETDRCAVPPRHHTHDQGRQNLRECRDHQQDAERDCRTAARQSSRVSRP